MVGTLGLEPKQTAYKAKMNIAVYVFILVGLSGIEPLTAEVSALSSNQTELQSVIKTRYLWDHHFSFLSLTDLNRLLFINCEFFNHL